MENGLQEKQTFLTKSTKVQTKSPPQKRKWTKKKICLISCLCCVLLVLLVIGGCVVFIFTRGSYGGNTQFWESLLNSSFVNPSQITISGTYNLVTFDDHYEEYLKSMGIPFFIVPLILSASERIEIEVSEGEPATVKMKTITDWMTRTSEFHFDEEFSMTYGKGSMEGLMYNICSRPVHNVINCKSEERKKKWNFESEIVFSLNGMVNKRTFITKDIVTKKYYQREGTEDKHPISVVRDERSTSPFEQEMEANFDWVENGDDDGWLDE